MAELDAVQIRQTPSPLPPLPATDALTAQHWGILCAIADTVVPSLTPLEGNRLLQYPLSRRRHDASRRLLEQSLRLPPDHPAVPAFLAENATAAPDFKAGLARILNVYLNDQVKRELLLVLSALK